MISNAARASQQAASVTGDFLKTKCRGHGGYPTRFSGFVRTDNLRSIRKGVRRPPVDAAILCRNVFNFIVLRRPVPGESTRLPLVFKVPEADHRQPLIFSGEFLRRDTYVALPRRHP